MVVALRDLPAHRAIDIDNAFVREALAKVSMREALERPADDESAGQAHAVVDLYGEDDNVFLRGKLVGWFEVACSRCLDAARITLDEQLTVTFMPLHALPADLVASARAALDGEPQGTPHAASGCTGTSLPEDGDGLELTMDASDADLELYGYRGDEVDLEPLFRDLLLLAVPFAPLCEAECKGLCPSCGINRNRTTCQCTPAIDPRWEALKNFRM